MTQAYWFKPRRYGYGATPTSWQGWAAIVVFLIAVPLAALALMWAMPNALGVLAFLIFIPLAVFGFIAFARTKTEGEWRWSWGDRPEANAKQESLSKN